MTAAKLSSYDPAWQSKWDAQYQAGLELWKRAIVEIREYGSMRPETKAAWRDTITSRRKARKRGYETTADVARRMFNILAGRAYLAGYKLGALPDPEDFNSLREIREYFSEQLSALKVMRAERAKRPIVNPMPVLPRGEGRVFTGNESAQELLTQKFYIPDLGNGVAVVVTYQRLEDENFVCLSSNMDHAHFRAILPRLVTLLQERLFTEHDPNTLHVYVHHPLGNGPHYQEQFWKYDLRPDARGAFQMAAREQLQVVPYGIANKQFADQQRESETGMMELSKYWPHQHGVLCAMAKQERITERIGSIRARKAARKMGARPGTGGLVVH